MGLFRRGTKLLRLGSGLRDCCCRPENPEVCFCPDWCRYYWDWGGTTIFPAREYLKNSCETAGVDQTAIFEGYDSFGFLETVFNFNAYVGGGVGAVNANAIGFSRGCYIDGFVSEAAQEEIFGVAYPQVFGWYYVGSALDIFCDIDTSTGRAGGLSFFAFNFIDIRINYPGLFPPYFVHLVRQYVRAPFNESVSLNANAECQANNELFCISPIFGDGLSRLHLTEDVEFVFSETGITVNGTLYEWEEEQYGLYGELPITDNRDDTDLWKVAGDFPFEATVTLKRRDSCRPGVCDCDLDLTGRTVVFEGQTFTYGSLQQFISDDGLTIWEEGPSAGRFTRADRRECDPTVSMRVRTAEVSCSTFDGVPRWFVYLDSECYERESGGCAPTVTASKITLYNGALSCDSDGYPLGAAHSFTDDTDPPDLDGETISGTPSTNCDVENPIPSISFS